MPVIAVLSGAGDDNFGDEVMFRVLETGLGRCRLVRVVHPATELRLSRIGLSGRRLFSGLILGGGTLINPFFFARIGAVLDPTVPAWSVGTGVGSAGFGMAEPGVEDTSWSEPLTRFRRVTVRGPFSAQWLSAAGHGAVEIVGDLAFAATPDHPLAEPSTRRLLVNVAGQKDDPADRALVAKALGGLTDALGALAVRGWTFRPIALHRTDTRWLEELGARIGGWAEPITQIRSTVDAQAVLQTGSALVAIRLHAAAFGWMSGVPTLALGYRAKTLDLAEHLGVGAQVLDLATESRAAVAAATVRLVDQSRASAKPAHDRALAARERIRALLVEIDSEIPA